MMIDYFIHMSAICFLLLNIILNVKSLSCEIEKYCIIDNKEENYTFVYIFTLLIQVITLFIIIICIFKYNDFLLVKYLSIFCIGYFYLSSLYILIRNIIFKFPNNIVIYCIIIINNLLVVRCLFGGLN